MKKTFFHIDPSFVLLPFLFLKTPLSDLFLFLLAVFIHEAGHLFCLRLFSCPLKGISFSLGGGKIFMSDPFIPYRKEILIYLSGPFFNLIACVVLVFLLRMNFTREGVFFLFSNLLLALFNLLPLPGLDGEGALSASLSLFLSPETRDKKMREIEKIFFILLFAFSLYLLIEGKNPSLLILSLGLQGENRKRKKATKIS